MKKRTVRNRPILFVVISYLALAPAAPAVDPPPGGGYPDENTALGDNALLNLIPGSTGGNTAIGFESLHDDTTGSDNAALGYATLWSNTTGSSNTAVGLWALHDNTTASSNTAVGSFSLVDNTTGGGNTAVGADSLSYNTTGYGNTAGGITALNFNTTGAENVAIGDRALTFNGTGSFNTAIGFAALNHNTTGTGNIALGRVAGVQITTGDGNIDIGNQGKANDAHTIRIGSDRNQKSTYIAGINGTTVASGVGVVVDANGRLGTITSSARYKEAIKPMAEASEAILSLEPVRFRYKKALDPQGIPQFGLVAEEVAKVDPDLVARDQAGKPYTVRYEAVNAMLLNEFLKEHRKVKTLETTVARQEKEIAGLIAGAKEQAAAVRKVNEQLRSALAAPPMVVND